MRLDPDEADRRLRAHDHGVLATLHPERGVDTVPVVYAVVDDLLGVPVDRVKPKSSSKLQRERNLRDDPRASLLVEHWDRHDWSALWWVRAQLHHVPGGSDRSPALLDRLARTFPQYRDRPFSDLLVMRIVDITGWSA